MTDRELMQQALEAMEYADACLKKQLTTKTKHEYAQDWLLEAGTALRERLAQPEQKPVLETVYETIIHWDESDGKRSRRKLARRIVDLYSTPPQRKPLNEEEIQTCRHMIDWTAEWSYINFARAIEAAHGIKGEA